MAQACRGFIIYIYTGNGIERKMNPEVLLKAKLPPSEVSSAVGRLALTGTSCPFKPGWAVPELTCEKKDRD